MDGAEAGSPTPEVQGETMSTTENNTKKQIVEMVDILEDVIHLLSYISTTLTFWKLDTIFPGNLIKDSCEQFYEKINNYLSKRHSK